jgi:hypothetical protein
MLLGAWCFGGGIEGFIFELALFDFLVDDVLLLWIFCGVVEQLLFAVEVGQFGDLVLFDMGVGYGKKLALKVVSESFDFVEEFLVFQYILFSLLHFLFMMQKGLFL